MVLGEFDLDMDPDLENAPKAIRRKPDKIIPHQHYNKRTSNYDIGLIRVSQMVPLGQLAVPICLDWTGQLAKVNEATISGWGRTFGSQNSKQIGQNVEGYTNILVKASVPVWNQTYCESFKKVYPSLSTVIHICAGGIQGRQAISTFLKSFLMN